MTFFDKTDRSETPHQASASGRRRAGALLALGLTMGGAAVAQAPSALAASCYSGSCRGLNPNATSCAGDARTILSQEYKAESQASFRLEVRYSPSCRSAWGRLTVYPGTLGNVGFALSAWNPNSPSVGAVAGSSWTTMIDGTPPDCVGTQFYVNGQWVRWYYLGCA